MEYIYNFTKANIKFLDLLEDYLKSISELPTDFYLTIQSQLSVVYTTELSPTQQTLLENSIIAYTPPQEITIPYNSDIISISKAKTSSTSYSTVGNYFFKTKNISNSVFLDYFSIISYLMSSKNEIGNYKIRIYNPINNTILGESITYNNDIPQIINIDDITNIPTVDSLLEIQVQVDNSNNICIIISLQVYYSEIFS